MKLQSTPEDNWFTLPCKLKRNYLFSYKIAEEELDRMLDAEDTEQERAIISQPRRRVKVLLPKSAKTVNSPYNTDLNDLAASCIVEPSNVYEDVVTAGSRLHYLKNYNVILPDETIQQSVPLLEGPDEMPLENIQLQHEEQQDNIIMTTLNTVVENQHKIMKQLANFQVLFEMAMKNKDTETSTSKSTNCQNHRMSILAFEPIDSRDTLQQLNDKLNSADVFNEYVETLSFICGRNTKTKGVDHCYMLVDKFFTRKLFTLCSWAGGAKISNTKFPFKFFENVIALFFKLINIADSRFTLEECEDFFKGVIRNCIRRNTCLNKRTSRSKNRPKKLSYNVKACANEDNANLLDEGHGEKNTDTDETDGDGHEVRSEDTKNP